MIRLKESIAYAKGKGRSYKKREIAMKIWGNSTNPRTAYMNLLNLEKGKTRKVDENAINILCDLLGVSADYLFGRTDIPNEDEMKKTWRESINETTETLKALTEII